MPDLRQTVAALRYKNGMEAPVLVAKGRGLVAKEILRRAREAGLYVHQSAELVALLMQVDLDERIPPTLYRAVAEVLVWVHELEHSYAAKHLSAEAIR
jgi:flagellar biosynthesis protein